MVEWSQILAFQRSGIQPAGVDIVGILDEKVHQLLRDLPIVSTKIDAITQFLHVQFQGHDWTQSFARPQIIYYADALRPEILVALHQYLRTQCGNIENIYFFTSQNPGSDRWWHEWCQLYRDKSYRLVNWTPDNSFWLGNFDADQEPDLDHYFQQKMHALQHDSRLFMLLGGSATRNDRCYLAIRACDLYEDAYVDFMAPFPDLKSLLDYTENITYFCDQQEVDLITDLYDRYVLDGKFQCSYDRDVIPSIHAEKIDFQGPAWHLGQRCFFHLVRETFNDEVFASFTEKTLRSFAHFCIPLTVTHDLIRHLRDFGFWLPDDLVDYSYQTQASYHQRVTGAMDILASWRGRHQDLFRYMHDRKQLFIHNSRLALDMIRRSKIIDR